MTEATAGSSPLNTSPVMPSIDINSPSVMVIEPMTACFNTESTSIASTPQTAVFPIPRATTAACDVLPPREVRIPAAAIIPPRSSGLVSFLIKITFSPRSAAAIAAFDVNTALPTAAPGEAAIPFAIAISVALFLNCGNINCASCAPFTRIIASSSVIICSSTNCIAIRKAAAAVRLPTRVCKSHNLSRSTVNSISHKSL